MEVLMTPICINFSCSCIKDSEKESSEGIFQLGMEALPEWKIKTNTEYSAEYGEHMLLILSFYSALSALKCKRLEFSKELLYRLKIARM